MNEEQNQNKKSSAKKNPLGWFDNIVKKFIPNFNVRAIIYFTLIFAVAMYIEIWRISAPVPSKTPPQQKQETVIADQTYWDSKVYQNKIKNQTVDSFTNEFEQWLNGENQEFVKRKFEDILFINYGLTPETGGDLATVVPESFNYLENIGRARYNYAKEHGFLSDTSTLVPLGTIVCNIDYGTEQVTGIELYDWRYASMPKLAAFMKTNPDWKMPMGDKILDVSDPRIEDKGILKYLNLKTQPPGLFSFLIFRDSRTNRIALADSTMLDMNGVDAKLTLSGINRLTKNPKLYFVSGFEGCKNMNTSTPLSIPYGQSD